MDKISTHGSSENIVPACDKCLSSQLHSFQLAEGLIYFSTFTNYQPRETRSECKKDRREGRKVSICIVKAKRALFLGIFNSTRAKTGEIRKLCKKKLPIHSFSYMR